MLGIYPASGRGCRSAAWSPRPELDCAWVTATGDLGAPDGSRATLLDSSDHYEAMARARYVIFNDMLPRWFEKRDGQICLQTWHGTR